MVTFSRAAATEFKKRLLSLIGNAAHYIEIKTFHSYCFDLLGKVGSLEKSDAILKNTIEKIKNGEVEANRITKTVLVIDEAQDMNADEFALINTLMEQNEEMRVIAVGDDDQNIYEFRGASSKYLEQFMAERKAAKHELIENLRNPCCTSCSGFQEMRKVFSFFPSTIMFRSCASRALGILHAGPGHVILLPRQNQGLAQPVAARRRGDRTVQAAWAPCRSHASAAETSAAALLFADQPAAATP